MRPLIIPYTDKIRVLFKTRKNRSNLRRLAGVEPVVYSPRFTTAKLICELYKKMKEIDLKC